MNKRNHKWVAGSQKCVKCQSLFTEMYQNLINDSNFDYNNFWQNEASLDKLINDYLPCITDDEAKIKDIIE